MKIIQHNLSNDTAAEIIADEVLIKDEQDALDLMANLGYKYGTKTIILRRQNLCAGFFDLKTKIAGSILQKFINYHTRLIILGDFSDIASENFKSFIRETNKSKRIIFLSNISSALKELN
ncbi:MAG: DUF4180 domain-containing protein [Patescibacteria group bacterium]